MVTMLGWERRPVDSASRKNRALNVLQLVVVVDLIESHGLDGHETLDRWIFSQVDKSHCAASEFFQHLVAPEHAWCVAIDC